MDATERQNRLRALAAAEHALLAEKRRIAAERRALGGEEVGDTELTASDGRPLRLAAAFAGRRDLIVIHNMGKRCAWCTLWADGFQGFLPHLLDRCAVLLVSPDAPEVQREFAASRGWTLPMASAIGTSFTRDLGYETEDGSAIPGVSGLRMDEDGTIRRIAHAQLGPGDDFCSVWHLFDLLAEEAEEWQPRFAYREANA